MHQPSKENLPHTDKALSPNIMHMILNKTCFYNAINFDGRPVMFGTVFHICPQNLVCMVLTINISILWLIL